MAAAVAPREPIASKSVHSLRLGEESSTSSASEPGRPAVSRRDTEQILDYYQSEDAGRTYLGSESSHSPDVQITRPERQLSTSRRSTLRPRSAGRDEKRESIAGRASLESVASSTSGGIQRRTSQRSAGGADKRRMAIVEMDSRQDAEAPSSQVQRSNSSSSYSHSDNNLFARRGVDGSRLSGLALMAPPDAEPSHYTSLSPIPASAPPTAVTPIRQPQENPYPSGHHRSMSDAQTRKGGSPGSRKSPRDVGIVGTLGTMFVNSPPAEQSKFSQMEYSSHSGRVERQRPSTSDGDYRDTEDHSGASTAPVFQTPKSRSPSPLPATGDPPSQQSGTGEPSLSARGWTVGSTSQLTPSIGQEKDIGRLVAGPVVYELSLGQATFRRSPHILPSGLPTTEPPAHPYGDRDAPRSAGRLPFKPNQTGPSYLHYQPGVHSTAGPLPSPPRHIFTQPNSSPPPRPPRLLSPPPPARRIESNQSKKSAKDPHLNTSRTAPIASLQPPIPISRGDSDYSITAVSVSSSGSEGRSPEISPKTPEENEPVVKRSDYKGSQPASTGSSRSGSHVREGAFPASSVFLSHPSHSPPSTVQHQTLDEVVAAVGEATDEDIPLNHVDVLPTALVEPPRVLKRSHSRPDLRRESSWVSLSGESFGDGLDEGSPPSSYPSSREGSTHLSTANVASDNGHSDPRRASLPAPLVDSLRRFHSLPRPPSVPSITRSDRSRNTSPSSYPPLPKKTPSSWPEAMNFQDVLTKRTATERAIAYAAKIRELTSEESGLREWLAFNTRKERRDVLPAASGLPNAASRVFTKQLRHVSRNSMASEVTFAMRSDSYTATDLSPRPTTDLSSPTLPPSTLPYPSLAHGVGVRKRPSRSFTTTDSSSRGLASPASASRSIGGAFFASIGRKTSIRKDRTLPPNSPTKLMPSRQTAPVPQPRPIKIGAPPTIPGGPRAPARLVQRHNSVIPAPEEHSRPDAQGFSMPPRTTADSLESVAFVRQVEKLSDLLPEADKEVLASYLRRAHNQDPMLAIGAYLEDEKQGSLRSD